MSKKLIYLSPFVLVLGLIVCVANAAPLQQDPGPDGIVSVEAEHYDDNVEQSGLRWEETGPSGGFTGTAGMRAPSSGGFSTGYAADSPRLDYEVNFVKTGTYYPWILAWGPDGNSDTCHVGLDGQEIASCDQMRGWENIYVWSNRTRDPERGSFEVTSTGVHTLNIWMRERNLIVDKIVLTTNPSFTLTGTEPGPPESPRGARVVAFDPSPADGATDVPREVVLSWTAGAQADKHDVYFGANSDDVSKATTTADPNGVYKGRQDANIYTLPERLDFNTTYYWRVDEINAPPDYTIHEGGLWSFTTEPVAYAIENVTATASSSEPTKGPQNTVNGSGLDESGLLHSKVGDDAMWLSGAAGPQPTWIQFEFDKVYKLYEMWVWNSNETLEAVIGFGFKDVTIEYSANGTDYTALGTTHQFARASGTDGYAHNTTVDLSGVAAKYVRLTANSNWGGILPQYGLSEVRFLYIPVLASKPKPASGTTGVSIGTIDAPADVTLGFRAGREAAKHNVYFSTDQQAVIDGTAPVATVTKVSYGPLSLNLGKTYYWRVDEVNEAQTPATWQGELWNFTTQEYYVVDDFESYNDLDTTDPNSNRIFNAWIDGYGIATNGSVVGYENPPFAEKSIVHGDKQSMPFFYSNTSGAANSEAERTFAAAQNWTTGGAKTLSLWFYGAASNTAAQMYVKVNGSKVAYDGDASNLTGAGWQPWNIELASFGVNLQNVRKLSIGIDGNGATGTLFFDDIRLYSYDRQFITPVEPNQVNLVAHYQFEGNTNDSTGANNGVAKGAPTFVAGKIGQAIYLNPTDGSNDYVDCGNPSALNFGTGDWSVCAWVKTTQTGDAATVFANGGDQSGGIRYTLAIGEGGPAGVATITTDDDITKVQAISIATINDDQWHHAVGLRNGRALRVYVDGVLGGTSTLPAGYNLSGTSQHNAYVGAVTDHTDVTGKTLQKYFIGAIDDVRIYGRTLSQEEITWLAGKTKPFDKPF